MTTWYKLSIEVSADKLTTVVAVLSREGRNLQVAQLNPLLPAETTKVIHRKRPKEGEHTPRDIVLAEFKKNSVCSLTGCGDALAAAGYQHTTANSVLSLLAKEGLVVRTAPALYALASNVKEIQS